MKSSAKAGWLSKRHVNQIPTWNLQQCLEFLELSDTSQTKKLPGAKEAKLQNVKRAVLDLLTQWISRELNAPPCIKPSDYTNAVDAMNSTKFLMDYLIESNGLSGSCPAVPPVRHGDISVIAPDVSKALSATNEIFAVWNRYQTDGFPSDSASETAKEESASIDHSSSK